MVGPKCKHQQHLFCISRVKNAAFPNELGLRHTASVFLRESHLNEKLRARLGLTGPIMVDSGGFALSMNPALSWSVRHVGNTIEKMRADVFVTLDIPPGSTDSARERERKIVVSVKNYEKLLNRFPKKTIMPVVHGRTRSELQRSIKLIAAVLPNPKWVGIGGVVPLLQRRRLLPDWKGSPESFIAMSIRQTREEFQRARIHVFGAGGTRTFPATVALGADSADSIGWRQAAGFGSVFFPLKSQRILSHAVDKRPVRKLIDKDDLSSLSICRCPICKRGTSVRARVNTLKANFHNRAIHNAWTLAHQFEAWPQSRAELAASISSGLLGTDWALALKEWS
ncbi:hypothetical protein ACFIOY_32100 [Bradyrhizobium sp. TZ2]